MKKSINETILSKLKQPLHINYINEYITKVGEKETQKIIDTLISDGLVEESKYGKGYYVIKNNNK